jgi:hypothetical protein
MCISLFYVVHVIGFIVTLIAVALSIASKYTDERKTKLAFVNVFQSSKGCRSANGFVLVALVVCATPFVQVSSSTS